MIFDPREARHFLWDGPAPSRCHSVYTGDGDVVYPDKNYISNRARSVFCLQRNVEADIARSQQDLQQYEANVKRLTAQRTELDRRVNDTQRELNNCRNKLNRDQDKVNRLSREVQEQASYEEEAPLDVATLEEDVHNFDMKLGELCNELQEAQEQVDEVVPVVQQEEQELNLIVQRAASIQHEAENPKVNGLMHWLV